MTFVIILKQKTLAVTCGLDAIWKLRHGL